MARKDEHYVPGFSPFWQPGDPLPEKDGDGTESSDSDDDE